MDRFTVPERLPFSKAKLPRKVVLSYILDYVIIIVLFAAFWILDTIEPFHQHFALQNYTLQYPMAVHERVPIFAAIAVAVGGPIVVIALYTLVLDGIFSHHKEKSTGRSVYTFTKRLWELNCGILGLLLASGTAFVITQVLKNAAGKPRPDFISRCLPKPGSVDPLPFGLSDDSICTQTDAAIMKDGFRSFPSGHSSSSFAGLFYLTLYLSGKLHLYDTRGFSWKVFVVMVPTLAAALIALSRIEDARHHPFDVLFGSTLGTLCAWMAYRQYFPPLTEPWRKGRAYPIRSWGSASEDWEGDGQRREANPAYEQYSGQRRAGGGPGAGPDADGVELTSYAPPSSQQQQQEAGNDNVFRQQVAHAERLRHEHSPSGLGAGGGGPGGSRLRTAYAPADMEDSSDDDAGHQPHAAPAVHSGPPVAAAVDTAYKPYRSAAATEAGG